MDTGTFLVEDMTHEAMLQSSFSLPPLLSPLPPDTPRTVAATSSVEASAAVCGAVPSASPHQFDINYEEAPSASPHHLVIDEDVVSAAEHEEAPLASSSPSPAQHTLEDAPSAPPLHLITQ